MIGRGQRTRSHGGSAQVAVKRFESAAQGCEGGWHGFDTLLQHECGISAGIATAFGKFGGANGGVSLASGGLHRLLSSTGGEGILQKRCIRNSWPGFGCRSSSFRRPNTL